MGEDKKAPAKKKKSGFEVLREQKIEEAKKKVAEAQAELDELQKPEAKSGAIGKKSGSAPVEAKKEEKK